MLLIDNTELVMQTGGTISISDNASIIGINAAINSDTISITDSGRISGFDNQQSATVNGNVAWSCDGEMATQSLILNFDLSLSSNCHLQVEMVRSMVKSLYLLHHH